MNVLVSCRYGGSRSLSERLSKLPPGRHLVPQRLRRPEPARADAAGDGGAGRRARLPEDDDRADREDRAGRPGHLLRALLQQGGVLPRRLRRERRRGARRSSPSCSTPSSPGQEQISAGLEIFLEMVVKEQARAQALHRRGPGRRRRGAGPLPGDAGERGAEAARGARATTRARAGCRTGSRWRSPAGSSGWCTSAWSPDEVDELKGAAAGDAAGDADAVRRRGRGGAGRRRGAGARCRGLSATRAQGAGPGGCEQRQPSPGPRSPATRSARGSRRRWSSWSASTGYAADQRSRWSASAPASAAPHFDRCFAGKEDCFLGVHDEVAAEFCQRVGAAYAGPRAWHDRIWAGGWAAMRFLAGGRRRAPASSSSPSTAPAAAPRPAATGSCSGSPTSSTAAAASSRSRTRSPAAPPKSSPARSTARSSAKVEDGCDRARRGIPARAGLHGDDALPRRPRRRGRAAGPAAALGARRPTVSGMVDPWPRHGDGRSAAKAKAKEAEAPRRPTPRRACPPAATACRASSSPRTSASGSSPRWSTPSPSAATTPPPSPTSPKRPRSPAAPSTSTSPTRKPASSPPTKWSPTTSATRCGPRPRPSRSGRSRCGRRWRRCCASSPASPSWPASA